VRVLGPDGAELPRGEVGELAVRSAGAAPVSDGPGSVTADQDGWVRTGDLGFLAGDDEVRLVGRAAELVFLRGGRVSPESVEEILARRIPGSVEFVVAGVPTLGTWDRIAVFVSGDEDSAQVREARHNLTQMTGPFRPHVVRVVSAIPRGPMGKPLRRELLRELATEV
jgi:long-chain acyl-CoA synthetase